MDRCELTVVCRPFHLNMTPKTIGYSLNITSGQGGVPLTLNLTVLDTSCQPIVDGLVEFWQSNATGARLAALSPCRSDAQTRR